MIIYIYAKKTVSFLVVVIVLSCVSFVTSPAPAFGIEWSNASIKDFSYYQRLLVKRGFDPGPIDGLPGKRTTAAIKEFQKSRSLVADGILGPITKAELEKAVDWTNVSIVLSFKSYQKMLKEMGYDPGPIDGLPGPQMSAAVTRFQSSHGLDPDGDLGPLTKAALEEAYKSYEIGNDNIVILESFTPQSDDPQSDDPFPNVPETFPIGEYIAAKSLSHCIADPLALGKYDRVVTGWMNLDLQSIADRLARERGESVKFRIQTIFDNNTGFDVKDTESIIDNYNVRVQLNSELDASEIFQRFIKDIDGYIAHTFDDFAVWHYPYGIPMVGDIIEIDVRKPFSRPSWVPGWATDWVPDWDYIPRNAPIMVIDVQNTYITAATLELNDKNHAVHGIREFGYEYDTDGTLVFYARAISTVGPLSRAGGGRGEKSFWSAWVDSMSKKLEQFKEVKNVQKDKCQEDDFLKGQDIFNYLSYESQTAFKYWTDQFPIVGIP